MSALPAPRPSNLTSRVVHPVSRAQPAEPSPLVQPGEQEKLGRAQVNVRIDAALVRRTKAKLALRGQTMQDLVAELLTEWTADESSQ